MKCPYCNQSAEIVKGKVLYPHRPDLYSKYFYLCKPCYAYVGCHPGTTNPLGRLANADLRDAKQQVHSAFDPLWKNGSMKRKEAYHWLARQLGISIKACHIGLFDLETCKKAKALCNERNTS